VLEFRRIARPTRDGGPMRYVVYEKMALSKMTEIATALARTHAALGLTLIHRHGPVQVGETVVYVAVRAHTRSAAVACLNDLVDVVKRDAPIWRVGG
jgi:molybdopterin synthase catalytic subunit